MKDKGLDYIPTPPEAIVGQSSDLKDRNFAETYGFFPPSPGDGGGSVPAETVPRQPPESRTEEWTRTLEKCEHSAASTLRDKYHIAAIQKLVDDANSTAATDPEVVEAARKWRDCAQSVGILAESRADLINRFLQQMQSASPGSANEKQIFEAQRSAAVATFDCSQSYDAVYDKVLARVLDLDP